MGVEGPVVAGRDGKALEGGPGGVSQQGQQLLPCPGLLQHSCEEVGCPAASHAVANTLWKTTSADRCCRTQSQLSHESSKEQTSDQLTEQVGGWVVSRLHGSGRERGAGMDEADTGGGMGGG